MSAHAALLPLLLLEMRGGSTASVHQRSKNFGSIDGHLESLRVLF
jgi:hypothetical protein